MSMRAQLPAYAPTNNLIAWYNFDGSGADASGNGNTGVVFNCDNGADRHGQPDASFNFYGSSSEVVVPYNPTFNAYPFSISLWCKLAEDNNGGMLIQQYSNSSWNGWVMSLSGTATSPQTISPGYMLAAPPNCNGVVSSAQCDTGINYSGDVFDSQWHMLTFTVDADSGRFYVDGMWQTSQVWTGAPGAPTNTDDLRIGGTDLGDLFFFTGAIDEVGLWSRTLDATEIEQLYTGSPPSVGCTNSNACNYTPTATSDNGSCTFNCAGCIDPCACNYNQNAVYNDGSCNYLCNTATSFITVFHDGNANGTFESNERPMQYWPVLIEELQKTVYTNADGVVGVPLPAGTIHYTLINTTSDWESTTPAQAQVESPGLAPVQFGLRHTTLQAAVQAQPLPGYYDGIHCIRGMESGMFVRNTGGAVLHGTLTLACDPLFVPATALSLSTPPTSSGAGFATWDIASLAPWETQLLSFAINGPGSSFETQVFDFSLHLVLQDDGGIIVYDETSIMHKTVSCLDQPSRLQPDPVGYLNDYHFVLPGTRVTFRMQFQNDTELPVQNVMLIQNLNSQQFDLASFDLLYTSEAVVGCLHDDGTIDLEFNGINLPSVYADPLNATGYAVYAARLRDDFARDSAFYNDAHVVFDMSDTHSVESIFHTLYDCNRLIGIEGNYQYCEGDSVRLEATALDAQSYNWYLGDSLIAIGRIMEAMYTQGAYTFGLQVTDSLCSVSDYKSVEVFPLPSGQITWVDNMLVASCNGTCTWYHNGAPMNVMMSDTVEMVGDGIYTVLLQGQGGCTSWTDAFIIDHVDEPSTSFLIYPNPTATTVNIDLLGGVFDITLTDAAGREVWRGLRQQQRVLLDVTSYAQGVYHLYIAGQGAVHHRMVVVE